MEIVNSILKRTNEQFDRSDKIILRANFTQNTNKQIKYTKEFINNYNEFTNQTNTQIDNANEQGKESILNTYTSINSKIREYIRILEINLEIPNEPKILIDISNDDLEFLFEERDNQESDSEYSEAKSEASLESEGISVVNSVVSQVNMAHMGKVEFLALCGRTINKTFEGDPLDTRSFTDSHTNSYLTKILINFILSKLNGAVREKVPTSNS